MEWIEKEYAKSEYSLISRSSPRKFGRLLLPMYDVGLYLFCRIYASTPWKGYLK